MAQFLAPFWSFLFDKLGVFGIFIAVLSPVILIILLIILIAAVAGAVKGVLNLRLTRIRNQIQYAIDEEEYEKAFDLWQNLASKTSLTADESYKVALVCKYGSECGWTKSGRAASPVTWYKKAANMGHLESKYALALLALRDAGEDRLKSALAYDEIRNLAKLNCPEAKKMVADIEQELEKELQKGGVSTAEAAVYGHGESQFAYGGELISCGDFKAAVEWLNLASKNGCTQAKTVLGSIYLTGANDIPADTKRAVELLTDTGEKGDEDACLLLGEYYAEDGSTFDLEKAIYWFGKLEKTNNPDVLYNLAMMYYKKSHTAGVDERFGISKGFKDTMTARKYIEDAAYYGSQEAKAYMARHNMKSQEELLQEICENRNK